MKAAIISLILCILVFCITVLPASAADSSPAVETGTAQIAELYSDLESFDVTLYSDKPYEHLTLEVILLSPAGNNEEVLARQVFPIDNLPANTRVTKIGFWDIRNAQRGAYRIWASLIENGQVLSESKYDFTYQAVSKLNSILQL
jgi:hypothetical protein